MCTNPIIASSLQELPAKSSWHLLSSADLQKLGSKMDWTSVKSEVRIREKNATKRSVTEQYSVIGPCFPTKHYQELLSSPPEFFLRLGFVEDGIGLCLYRQFYFPLPCRKCSECLQKRSKELAVQSVFEARSRPDNCVLILTYDNEHLGENKLDYSHVQEFQKRLRRYVQYTYNKKIRFLTVGEYGDKKGRMHWHMIVFGWKPEKTAEGMEMYYGGKFNADPRWRSRKLDSLWQRGYVDVDHASDGNIFYVSRYVHKKFVKGMDLDCTLPLDRSEKKTSSMGLGLNYFLTHLKTFIRRKRIDLVGYKYKIPRYYMDLLKKLVSEDEQFNTKYYNALRERVFKLISLQKLKEFLFPVWKVRSPVNFYALYKRALQYMETPVLKPHRDEYLNTS